MTSHALYLASALFAAAILAPTLSHAGVDVSAKATAANGDQRRDPKRFRNFFRPFRTDRAAISPDGRHLAFTLREGDKLYVITCAIEAPDRALAKLLVGDDEAASSMLVRNQGERTPIAINWMRWVSATRIGLATNQVTVADASSTTAPSNRLVVETNQASAHGKDGSWGEWHGAVIAFDADGSNARSWILSDLVSPVESSSGVAEISMDRADLDEKVDRRTWSADEPIASQPDQIYEVPDNANRKEGFAEATPPETRPAKPGSLKIFANDIARPGSVTLMIATAKESTGAHWHQFLSLDVRSGKTTKLLEDIIPLNRESMIDRAGRLRLTLPNSLMRPLPHAYEYHGPSGRDKPVRLGEHLGAPSAYAVSAANYFGERSVPLGFDRDSDILYVASNEDRDTFGIYGINLTTKARTGFALENPLFDLIGSPSRGFPGSDVLIFDPYTQMLAGVRYENSFRTIAWVRPEWQEVQATLERRFPGRVVEIEDWDEAGNRFVVLIHGPGEAGALHVYDRQANRLMEFARRAPWMDEQHSHATLTMSFPNPDGTAISGLVTVPRNPRLMPAPLVVFLPSAPWMRVQPDYQTEVQALADMGFVVAQMNTRGAWGFGRKHREGVAAGYDQVQVADLATGVAKLKERFNIDPKRIALVGFEHGGFIALRAMQEHPDLFRCAVTINAPTELAGWLDEMKWKNDGVLSELTRGWFGSREHLAAKPLVKSDAMMPKRPLLMLHYPGPDGGTRTRSYLDARSYARRLRRAGADVQFVDLPADYMRGLPNARADAFAEMEGFLNDQIYDFSVKLGELRELKGQ